MLAAVTNSANEQRAARRLLPSLGLDLGLGLWLPLVCCRCWPFNVHTFHICAVHISFSMTLTGQCGKRAVCDEFCRVLHNWQLPTGGPSDVSARTLNESRSARLCVCVYMLICMLHLYACGCRLLTLIPTDEVGVLCAVDGTHAAGHAAPPHCLSPTTDTNCSTAPLSSLSICCSSSECINQKFTVNKSNFSCALKFRHN